MTNLKERFEDFMRRAKDFESIDHLMKSSTVRDKKIADYLLYNRTVIVEQKSLENDPSWKAQEFLDKIFLDKIIESRGIIAFGAPILASIFGSQPDAEHLNAEFLGRMNKPIDDIFANADKQLNDTRDVFFAPAAIGMLVILNENSGAFFPDAVLLKLRQMFLKRRREEGSIRYPHIDGAIIISEAHTVKHLAAPITMPILAEFAPDGSRRDGAIIFAGQLAQNWAAYNGAKFVESDRMIFQQRNQKPLQWKLPTTGV